MYVKKGGEDIFLDHTLDQSKALSVRDRTESTQQDLHLYFLIRMHIAIQLRYCSVVTPLQ